MAKHTCSAADCDRAHYGRGLCQMHLKRFKKTGSTDSPKKSEADRFWEKVDKSGDCWDWTGAIRSNGYGVFNVGGKTVRVHRYAFESQYGFTPDGDIDHICRNRKCVRYTHLRPATRKQNSEHLDGVRTNNTSGHRGVYFGGGRWRAQITHNGKTTYVGGFDTAGDAAEAAKQARLELFTYNDLDRQ